MERKSVENHRTSQPVLKGKHTLVCRLPHVVGPQLKACKSFFLNTLAISESVVKYNLNNKTGCIITSPKPRTAHNKTSQEKTLLVKEHINNFPKVERRKTLLSKGHIQRNPRGLVECKRNIPFILCLCNKTGPKRENCEIENLKKKLLNSEFNLSFHKRSKDQCDTRAKYFQKQKSETATVHDTQAHEDHLRCKQQARDNKEEDKKPSDHIVSAVFDLQQVMTCTTKVKNGFAYYLRKLNVYSLTIYELLNTAFATPGLKWNTIREQTRLHPA